MSKLILNVTLRRHFFVSVSSSSPRAIQLIRITFPNRPTSDHRFCTTRVLSSLSNHSRRKMEAEHYQFGPYEINPKEVFYSSKLSYALVNLRPLVPGHVLVCPRREVKRFIDLTADETSDLWCVAQKIGCQLESYHNASSLTFAIQDGPQAGQTVPHVHVHIIPRKSGDFEKNDEIYDALDEKEKELKQSLDLDKERKDRSMEEMAQEADEYRKLFL
ncbi:bifunctional bis(5'-adenosyl)-triphosphatase/adenylylsulfatase FHIT [Ipomoea triloba]|uniref:bifunctional bis(5'-adenosyl)-triphosphatase/adenylylsulfatase FHIT n=1 Tax=Ipomoea triloba TaxID=35885 RepID=UPI00125D8CA2|nr:bifunctional bis(5'-adenosyl)-triphosphatase/adenylylsulfatase FHIT [Ipomoea triloba]